MSKNVETVQDLYAQFGLGDVAGILERLAPDVEWEHDWGSAPLRWFVPRRGRGEVAGFFETLTDFEFAQFEPVAFLEGGGLVAVPIRLELVHKASGNRIRDLEMHLWSFDADGRVARFRHFTDTLQFAKATGA